MLKTLLTATAVSALMVSGALAQANPPGGSSPPAESPPPAATPAPGGAGGSAAAGSAQFVQSQRPDQFLASRFRGTDVVGQNDERIGDVNDVLFSREGRIEAVIVGVGGFLGIGEKDVALPMTAFQIVPADTGAGANTAANRGGGAGTAGSGAGGNTGSAATGGAGTGGGAGAGGGASGSAGTASNDPTNVRLKLSMTKEQLNNAPAFQQVRARGGGGSGAGDTGSGAATSGRSGSGAGTGPTPRP